MTSTRMSGSATPVGGDLGALDETVIRFAHLEDGRRDVFEASRIGVVVTDIERNVRYANRAALRMLGLPSNDGIKLESIFRDETAREILRRAARLIRSHGFLGNYSVEGRRPNNKHVFHSRSPVCPYPTNTGSSSAPSASSAMSSNRNLPTASTTSIGKVQRHRSSC